MLLECVEQETGPAPAWTVLWLHGLGADGHDFAPIVPELVRPQWPALRFVFPHAPLRPVTINGGMRMRAWYDIVGMDFATRAEAAGVEESIAQVEALIARESERGTPPSRLLLAGFSQGGAIALATGLRRRQPLAGLVALSTYLPGGVAAASARDPNAVAQPGTCGISSATRAWPRRCSWPLRGRQCACASGMRSDMGASVLRA